MYNGRRCWDEDRSNGSQRSREATDFNTREVVASRLRERGRRALVLLEVSHKEWTEVPRNVFQGPS